VKVIDISRVKGFGTQVVVRHGGIDRGRDIVKLHTSDPRYAQFMTAAKQIAKEHDIQGELIDIDLHGLEAQISWKELPNER
jgi:hypothetical protein